MKQTPLLLALSLLAASARAAAQPAAAPDESAVDWVLRRAANVFTSDSKVFGEAHFPVIAANPNSGTTYGVLPVWLVNNSRKEIEQIYAPMLTYNPIYGVAFDGSYYYYPTDDAKLRVALAKSQKSNYRVAFRYEDRALLDGRATLLLDENYEADGGAEFYGLGARSRRTDEASERLLETYARGELGLRFLDVYIAAAGWTQRHTNVQPGPFPAMRSLDPALQTGTAYALPRLSLSRDSRDLPFTPAHGSLTELYAERSVKVLGSSSDYGHYGGQWRFYTPTGANLVTVLHAQGEWSGGGEVPFTALSTLGGPRSLRGFAEGRFQDRGSAFVNVEERCLVHSIDIVHSLTEFQIAPFLETGTVFPSPGKARARDLAGVAGVAFRAVVKPAVVGRVEVGVGREGAAVFVGVDYPF